MMYFLRMLFRPDIVKREAAREAERQAQVQEVRTRLQVIREQLETLDRRKRERTS